MPAKPSSLEDLKRLQREDAEGQIVDPEAHAGELTAGRRWKRLRAWLSRELDAWTVRLERVGKWVKALATVLGGLGFIGGLVWRSVVFYRTRSVPPPDQPPHTDVASTTVDRVPNPVTPNPHPKE